MDIGPLVLRLAVGLLVAGHGVQKVSFRLGGPCGSFTVRAMVITPMTPVPAAGPWTRPWA